MKNLTNIVTLTEEKIEELAFGHDVRTTAVLNFLWSVGENETADIAYANLSRDVRAYGWNTATVNAIRAGIKIHFSR